MKHRLILNIFSVIVVIILSSCTGFFDLGKEEIIPTVNPDRPPSTTLIYFNNSANTFTVDVFSSYTRGARLERVNPLGSSASRSWIPTNEGFTFYLTYYLPISDIQIPYIPNKYGVDFITYPIIRNQTTPIHIPNLKNIVPVNEPLFDEVFVSINNQFPSAIQLLSGSSIVQPEGSEMTIVPFDQTALYKFNSNVNFSIYAVLVQGNRKNIPAELDSLQKGYFYELNVDSSGNVSFVSSKLITLSSL